MSARMRWGWAAAALLSGLATVTAAAAPPTLFAAPAAADRAPNAQRGRIVAREWCARCHVVRRGRAHRATDAAPSFHEVANRPDTTHAKLRRILERPHNRMPTEALYRDEIADLIAYIRSLKRR